MTRAINFGAGPATIPRSVLETIHTELLNWRNTGASVMEISHRGADFIEMARASEAKLRHLMAIPEAYRVLFLQGGATLQFGAVPMNLVPRGAKANYICTGSWSQKAIREAHRVCDVHIAANGEGLGFKSIPPQSSWDIHPEGRYLHYTPNETITGVEFHWIPEAIGQPLVADMSSTILSRPIPVEQFGLIYAGAQKNIGITGLTVVIVHEELLRHVNERTPASIHYALQAKAGSMENTPSTFSWYVADLVFDWIEAQGGLAVLGRLNQRKAQKLYNVIDQSSFYHNDIDKEARSWMNVTFALADTALDKTFLSLTQEEGLLGLKGHRLLGGMRASIYNAIDEASIDRLIGIMTEFERTYG